MKINNNKRIKKINFEVKRVYVGKKPIGEVFEEVIEHIVERNIEDNKKENKRKRK